MMREISDQELLAAAEARVPELKGYSWAFRLGVATTLRDVIWRVGYTSCAQYRVFDHDTLARDAFWYGQGQAMSWLWQLFPQQGAPYEKICRLYAATPDELLTLLGVAV